MPHSKRKLIYSGAKEITFSCDCGKKFPSERFLNRHVQISHKNSNLGDTRIFISCDICGQYFSNKFNLDIHRRLNHKNS